MAAVLSEYVAVLLLFGAAAVAPVALLVQGFGSGAVVEW